MLKNKKTLTLRRLRLLLSGLFVALTLPSALLGWQALQQIEWEVFYQYQQQAEALTRRIDAELQTLLGKENARSANAYDESLQMADASMPGLIGYFQLDSQGGLSIPGLPDNNLARMQQSLPDSASPGTPPRQQDNDKQRAELRQHMLNILTANQLATPDKLERQLEEQLELQPAAPAQALQLDELRLERGQYERALKENVSKRQSAESSVKASIFDNTGAAGAIGSADDRRVQIPRARESAPSLLNPAAIARFAPEVDPLQMVILKDGIVVMFRNVWRNGQRLIQGLLFEQAPFIEDTMIRQFRESDLATISQLVVASSGEVLKVVGDEAQTERRSSMDTYQQASRLQGILLHQGQLSAPLQEFQLAFTAASLPSGVGSKIVIWSTMILFTVLTLGLWVLYRLGHSQLVLMQQQRDFIAAVSHELKTPLTSIRLYSDILREGWANEDKKRSYYEFISRESERLSRLISNVLLLSRLERKTLDLPLQSLSTANVMVLLHSAVDTQIAAAGFTADYLVSPEAEVCLIAVEPDSFQQIMINVVDNALKFSSQCPLKRLEFNVQCENATITWSLRDFGPGIPKDQLRKVFQLFYRPGDELTRQTAGTGIGLALVKSLAEAMLADVEVINREPGAEFHLRFQIQRRLASINL